MALLRGTRRLNLRLCGRSLNRSCSPVGVRSLSDNVLSKTETPSGPGTASDHLLYTPEHFALKESLRKVRRSAANFDFTLKNLPKLIKFYEDAAKRWSLLQELKRSGPNLMRFFQLISLL